MSDNNILTQSTQLLKSIYGSNALFRDGQFEAIEATIKNNRTLVVQKTGWGKSLVYFICTKINRNINKGVTMVVSPLLVLMENQIAATKDLGLKCDVLNSTVRDRKSEIINCLKRNELDLILITPETLFSDEVYSALPNIKIGLFVIDEVHCISDWGHDFRLEYGKLYKILNIIPKNVPVLGTTATANNRVVQDLNKQLGNNVFVSRGPLTRDSLAIQILRLSSKAERYAWILQHINKLPGSGIIYCLTHRDCE
jgi:ATP-dependent DNA helicase RecQ